ncbi:MAG: TolC family protein [Betaproteobacteria bacterium]
MTFVPSQPPRLLLALALVVVCTAAVRAQEQPDALSFEQARGLLENNRDLQLARRAEAVARADAISASARPNPSLTFSTAALSPRGLGTGGPLEKQVDAIAQLTQLVERGGKRGLRMEAARLAVDAVRSDSAELRRQLVLSLAGAYWDLRLGQERTLIAAENVALLERTVRAAELRLKAGDISPTDLARIRVDLLRAENDRRQAEADRDRARLGLAFLLAAEARAPSLRAADPLPDAGEEPAAPPSAVEARADVRAAVLRTQAAEKARDLARALRTRDVTVAAQYERYPSQISNNTLGFGVSVPLFLFYNYDGEIARAENLLTASQQVLERVRAAAVTEIARAASDLAAARDRVRRYDAGLLRDAQRAADAAEFAYRNGALGVIDLLDARRVLVATRVDAAGARAELARARIAFREAASPAGEAP